MPIRSLLIWGVIALILVVAFTAMQGQNPSANAAKWSYSRLIAEVNQQRVASAVVRNDAIEGRTSSGEDFVTYVPLGAAADALTLLNEKGVDVSSPPPRNGPGIGDILLGVLPMLLLIGAWFFFMRQMQSGGRGAMGFGRSKAKLLTEAKGRITFEDVAGVDEAKEELGEIVEFLKDPGKAIAVAEFQAVMGAARTDLAVAVGGTVTHAPIANGPAPDH